MKPMFVHVDASGVFISIGGVTNLMPRTGWKNNNNKIPEREIKNEFNPIPTKAQRVLFRTGNICNKEFVNRFVRID